jgi:hypothetical protein
VAVDGAPRRLSADDYREVLLAALLATAALSAPADVEDPQADRYNPVPPTTLTLAHNRWRRHMADNASTSRSQ